MKQPRPALIVPTCNESIFQRCRWLRGTADRALAKERLCHMFTAEQYRAKAAEYKKLLDGSPSPEETREYRNLEQTFTLLADNEEWLRRNAARVVTA